MQVLVVSKSQYILLIGLGLLEIEIAIEKCKILSETHTKLIIKFKQNNETKKLT